MLYFCFLFVECSAAKGLFDKLKALLLLHTSETAHADCCQINDSFGPSSTATVKELIENRKLLAEIDESQIKIIKGKQYR